MNWNLRPVTLGLLITASFALRSAAQVKPVSLTPEQLRDMIIEDSLTPAKMQLRDVVAQLRDTLITVQALHARISRNLASGAGAVVLSDARELGKRCRVSAAMADATSRRIATMYTSEPKGDLALNGYRVGLASLVGDLRTCQHDDSLALVAPKPDQGKIEEVATAARDAVARYDIVRDALMKMLSITLPVTGHIRPAPRR